MVAFDLMAWYEKPEYQVLVPPKTSEEVSKRLLLALLMRVNSV